jgi:N-methylhydantoinase B
MSGSDAPARSGHSHLADPITFEVFKNAVVAVADDMCTTLLRTGHSPEILWCMDFSTAIADADGRIIAQGLGMPLHLGVFPDAVSKILREYAMQIEPGDVFFFNDPHPDGMHLPDIFVVAPIFTERLRVGFALTVVHHLDVGGRLPGGQACDSTEIFQEGIQIPLVKLYERGRLNEALLKTLLRNVRRPEFMRGDLEAQVAACSTGAAAFLALLNRYSEPRANELVAELLDYSEGLARAEIERIPDGTYEFEDFIDDDGLGSEPIPVRVCITVEGSDVTVDFTGTSPQVRSAINTTMGSTRSAVYLSFAGAFGADIPANAGFYRPFHVVVPENSLLNPRRPAAVAARGIAIYRVMDAIWGALASVVPSRIPAAGDGGLSITFFASQDASGQWFLLDDGTDGGWGGRLGEDGIDGISHFALNVATNPVEEMEADNPIRVEQFGFVPDSGGPGQWRGGLAMVRELRFLNDEGLLMLRTDRHSTVPYGLAGGSAGTPSWNILNAGPSQRVLGTKDVTRIELGDVFRHITAGSGGYGPPLARSPDAVLEDILEGKITPEHARRAYGVVFDPATNLIDQDATGVERNRLSGGRAVT